ncbi:MAG: hypothetical protein IKS32_04150 [Solobacterium sp.]|nr:hypothetical protein [Solobacterium sp.]
MKAEINIRRSSAVISETQAEKLDQWSDYPYVHSMTEDRIYGKLCCRKEETDEAVAQLSEILGFPFPAVTCSSDWYETHTLAVLISEERSGSSRLTLESAEKMDEEAVLVFSRVRGLTMDMSLALITAELQETGMKTVSAKVVTDLTQEAGIF